MIRRLAALLAVLALAVLALAAPVRAEGLLYTALSVTDTSQTATLTRNSTGPMVCNLSTTDRFHVRFFTGNETAAAATTSDAPVPVAIGSIPSCISIPWDSKVHSGAGFKTVTYIAASGKTPTGGIYY